MEAWFLIFFLFQILNHVIVQHRSREGFFYTLMIIKESNIEARDVVALIFGHKVAALLLPLQPSLVAVGWLLRLVAVGWLLRLVAMIYTWLRLVVATCTP